MDPDLCNNIGYFCHLDDRPSLPLCSGTKKTPNCGGPGVEESSCDGYTISNAPAGQGYQCIWTNRGSCDSYELDKKSERLCRLPPNEPPAGGPPADSTPAEDPPADDPPVEDPAAEGPPAEGSSDQATPPADPSIIPCENRYYSVTNEEGNHFISLALNIEDESGLLKSMNNDIIYPWNEGSNKLSPEISNSPGVLWIF